MPEPANSALDDARKRARRRLVGAIVLALGAAVVVPLFLESDPKPLGPDVQVQIPAIDDAKFQNRLTPSGKAAPAEKPTVDKAPLERAPTDKAAGSSAGSQKSTGMVTETAPVASDTTAAKPVADPSAAAARPTVEGAGAALGGSTAQSPATQQSAHPAPTGTPKASSTGTEGVPKAKVAKEQPRESAQKDATKQAEAKKAAPKKAAEPEPATNLGTATLNTTPPASKSGGGEFVVQIGAFADRTVATELATKAGEQGFPVFLEPVTTKSGPIQRVRVGPFATRAAADQAAAKLAAAGFTAVARAR